VALFDVGCVCDNCDQLDDNELVVENGVFRSFHAIVRRQLDPVWNLVGAKTKQLVADLKTLQELMEYVHRCISPMLLCVCVCVCVCDPAICTFTTGVCVYVSVCECM